MLTVTGTEHAIGHFQRREELDGHPVSRPDVPVRTSARAPGRALAQRSPSVFEQVRPLPAMEARAPCLRRQMTAGQSLTSLTQGRGTVMLKCLLQDEAGFIISAELVLVSTLLVVGLVVGLSEVQHAVAAELNDVADAIGSLNQSFCYSGMSVCKPGGCGSEVAGSAFRDTQDDCDNNQCDLSCDRPVAEGPKFGGGHKW